MSDAVRVPLGKTGLCALVDARDHKVLLVKWRASRNRNGKFYAISSRFGMLHNYIAHPEPDMVVDHINGDGLDNRRANLRIATVSENAQARPVNANSKTGFKGVYPNRGRYRAQARIEGIRHDLGSFSDPRDAAKAYDAFVVSRRGPAAQLNFPEAHQ